MIVATTLGFFGFSLVEYVHHRVGGHVIRRGRLYTSHQAHHRDPREGGVSLATKLRQRAGTVAIGALALGAPLVAAFGVDGVAATFGLWLGYLVSEAVHHAMHHRGPKNGIEAWLWRHHYAHHWIDPTCNHGFTSPIWDLVFGTYRAVREVSVPADQLPTEFPGVRARQKLAPARKYHASGASHAIADADVSPTP